MEWLIRLFMVFWAIGFFYVMLTGVGMGGPETKRSKIGERRGER
jgi:hypothetical protein